MNFTSDNATGIAPEILDAIVRANAGYALAYGADAATARLERRTPRRPLGPPAT